MRVLEIQNRVLRHIAASAIVVLLGAGSALAQSGDVHPQDQSKPAPTDAAKNNGQNPSKADEFTQAAQAINGPGGNPECVWLGRRIVQLIWRDDPGTAFRFLDVYDRFGCPGNHIQATFRCLTRFADELEKDKDLKTLQRDTHACWLNPAAQPQVPAAAAQSNAPVPSAPPSEPSPPPAASPSPAAPPK